MDIKTNNQKRERIGIILCLIACVLFLGIFFLTSGIKQTTTKQAETKDISPEKTIETKISPPASPPVGKKEVGTKTYLEINGEKYESLLYAKASVYEFMIKLRTEGKINFKEDTYAGLGKFIKEINGLKNSGDKYWIYYVNGEKAKVGISNYIINGGDTVSWKYEKDLN